MNYPDQNANPVVKFSTLSEDETVDLCLAGRSLSRFGDGELRLALGGSAISQRADAKLAQELVKILRGSPALVAVPNPRTPKRTWAKYETSGKFVGLYNPRVTYGSAFISRPDSAPWIDRPDYWQKIRKFWEDRDIVFVRGDERSLRRKEMESAKSIVEVVGPRIDAYAEVDRIEEQVMQVVAGRPDVRVLMCLGAAATVLADRLAHDGVHAVDLGHVGMFMRHAGSYNVPSFEKHGGETPETGISYRQDFGLWWPDYDHNPVACHNKLVRRSRDARLFATFCTDFELCVQAGGHVGVWPRILAERFKTVLTFEPDPYLFACLVRNCKGVPNVFEFHNALGAKCELIRMLPHASAGSWRVSSHGTVDVAQTTVDLVVGDRSCGGIVLDVEGSELSALRGAEKTVARCRPTILVEGLPRKTPDVHKYLTDLGYVVAREVHADTIYRSR